MSRRQTLALPNNVVLAYGLDNADELNSLTWTLGGNTLGNIGYGYDVLGRRNQITGSFARLNTSTPVTLTVGSDGRIATENGSALQYDANGRLTQDVQYKYIWNGVGQLSQLLNPINNAMLASFKYDAAGRRIGKTISGQTTQSRNTISQGRCFVAEEMNSACSRKYSMGHAEARIWKR